MKFLGRWISDKWHREIFEDGIVHANTLVCIDPAR
jgi:hypothetical protein